MKAIYKDVTSDSALRIIELLEEKIFLPMRLESS